MPRPLSNFFTFTVLDYTMAEVSRHLGDENGNVLFKTVAHTAPILKVESPWRWGNSRFAYLL
jgi:hypothetical protein